MDYQYYISAWIYKVLKQADKPFADFLHNKGYGDQNKLYKLFCFSRLNFGKPKMWKEGKLFEIAANELKLKLSFDVSEAAANFIKGLFMQQEFFLGNRFNGIDLKVTAVEALPEPQFGTLQHYRFITPCVVSIKTANNPLPQYLMPDNKEFDYPTLLKKHWTEKLSNTRQTNIENGEINLHIEKTYRKSGYVIKPGTPEQTRVIGSLFDFSLEAPLPVHQLIWNAGACEKSSSGFGWVEMVEKD
ncbi:MAG: CRISPR-associated endoribonuclease Cas6 [Prolixibacteraceae bacterium]|nr:CRISPR-associated endoribonuclease Cas6 [Prolixibacteraceae bacterium]